MVIAPVIFAEIETVEQLSTREFDENINMESSNERIRLLANEGISVSTPVELTLSTTSRLEDYREIISTDLK